MGAATISMKFIVGVLIAILASSAILVGVDKPKIALTNAIKDYLGKLDLPYAGCNFEEVDGEQIFKVRVLPSPHPVYLKFKGEEEEFHIRSGNSSQELEISETPVFVREH
jgi:hypothetical protein